MKNNSKQSGIDLTESEVHVVHMAITLLQSILKTNKLGLPVDDNDLWKSELESARFKFYRAINPK